MFFFLFWLCHWGILFPFQSKLNLKYVIFNCWIKICFLKKKNTILVRWQLFRRHMMIQTAVIYFCIILPVPHIKTIRHIDATAHVSASVRVEDIFGFCSITVGKAVICDIYHTNLRAASFLPWVNSFFSWQNKPFICQYVEIFYILVLKTCQLLNWKLF